MNFLASHFNFLLSFSTLKNRGPQSRFRKTQRGSQGVKMPIVIVL